MESREAISRDDLWSRAHGTSQRSSLSTFNNNASNQCPWPGSTSGNFNHSIKYNSDDLYTHVTSHKSTCTRALHLKVCGLSRGVPRVRPTMHDTSAKSLLTLGGMLSVHREIASDPQSGTFKCAAILLYKGRSTRPTCNHVEGDSTYAEGVSTSSDASLRSIH